jgi:hypothetical protein
MFRLFTTSSVHGSPPKQQLHGQENKPCTISQQINKWSRSWIETVHIKQRSTLHNSTIYGANDKGLDLARKLGTEKKRDNLLELLEDRCKTRWTLYSKMLRYHTSTGLLVNLQKNSPYDVESCSNVRSGLFVRSGKTVSNP